MRRGHGQRRAREAPADGHSRKQQGLRHRRARAVKTQRRHAAVAQAEARADALIQQVPGKGRVKIRIGQPGLFQRQLQRHLLHAALGPLPALFAECRVLHRCRKLIAERPLALLFPSDGGKAAHDRRLRKADALPPHVIRSHERSSDHLIRI